MLVNCVITNQQNAIINSGIVTGIVLTFISLKMICVEKDAFLVLLVLSYRHKHLTKTESVPSRQTKIFLFFRPSARHPLPKCVFFVLEFLCNFFVNLDEWQSFTFRLQIGAPITISTPKSISIIKLCRRIRRWNRKCAPSLRRPTGMPFSETRANFPSCFFRI